VARLGVMTRAAEELHTVQSNVTARIRALEHCLGAALFERHSAGRYIDRLSTELEMLLTGGADGGLYVMIGRKRQ